MKTCPSCQRVFTDEERFCSHDGTELQSSVTPDDPLIGEIFEGKYRIEKRLGGGGMGAVYQARQLILERNVAVKIIKPHLIGPEEDEFQKRFLFEARTASSLNHPNIIAVHDFGFHDHISYLVTELLDGETLRERINREGTLPLKVALEITNQVAAALTHAHERGIVHRDLKPENVMLCGDWKAAPRCVVLDFGMAKALFGSAPDATKLTMTGVVIGTPRYVSPELAQGFPADIRTDIYSLGVMLYEMLAGAPPFEADSALQLILMHVSSDPPPICEISSESNIHPSVEAVVRKALEKDPEKRQRTALQLAQELTAAVEASRGVVASMSRRQSTRKNAGNLFWAARWAIGPLVIVLIAIGWFSQRDRTPPNGGKVPLARSEPSPVPAMAIRKPPSSPEKETEMPHAISASVTPDTATVSTVPNSTVTTTVPPAPVPKAVAATTPRPPAPPALIKAKPKKQEAHQPSPQRKAVPQREQIWVKLVSSGTVETNASSTQTFSALEVAFRKYGVKIESR
ncbi:MAG: serine/threonine protein kinase, partial [Bdellovibrionales bacterium]|nr:serine/threonine protein kinase [Bdellovibrionales bacterium]